MQTNAHPTDLSLLLDALGISTALLLQKNLPFYPEATDLVVAETDVFGKAYRLIPEAARAWWALKHAARQENIVVELVSAFRGIEHQADIIRAKLAINMPIETILTLSAPPGYSEHHTGRAVDINTPGCAATEEPFEHTEAFAWLTRYAQQFGFTLSYPRENKLGFIYEPWHWCYQPELGMKGAV